MSEGKFDAAIRFLALRAGACRAQGHPDDADQCDAAIRLLEAAGKVDKKDATFAFEFMKLTEQCWTINLRKSGQWGSTQIDNGKECIRALLDALPDEAAK